MELLLLAYLAYRNSIRARLKGLSAGWWALYTVIAYLAAMVTGGLIVIYNFCGDTVNLNQMSATDMKVRREVAEQLAHTLTTNPLHLVTIELFAVGGYLLVRYLIDRKPGKKEPELHWMDKLNNQSE